MRCKPGDLAVVVRARDPRNIGVVLRVVRLLAFDVGREFPPPYWRVDGAYEGLLPGNIAIAADCQLQPIRDPGEDARDETLQRLPAPSVREVEAA